MAHAPVHVRHQPPEALVPVDLGERHRQGRQRGLEAVGEVGDVPAGTIQVRLVLIEQGVHLLDQRPHLRRLPCRQPGTPTRTDLGKLDPEPVEGTQAEADLHEGPADEEQPDDPETGRERAECLHDRPAQRSRRGGCYDDRRGLSPGAADRPDPQDEGLAPRTNVVGGPCPVSVARRDGPVGQREIPTLTHAVALALREGMIS